MNQIDEENETNNEPSLKGDMQDINSLAPTIIEIVALKKLLYKIWGVTEVLQEDVNYIKRIYTKPIHTKKSDTSREERIAKLKYKLLTYRKKSG